MARKSAFARSKLPWLVAPVVALVVGVILWMAARHDARAFEEAGVVNTAPYEAVAALAALAAGVAFFVVRRLADGPDTRVDDWSLTFGHAHDLRLASLLDRLGQLGYRLECVNLDDEGAAVAPSAPSQELFGGAVWLRERSVRARRAGVVLRLAPGQPGQTGMGLVEVRDTSGVYEELSHYLLVALGELLPGLRFGRIASSLAPEDTSAIAAALPERPLHLR